MLNALRNRTVALLWLGQALSAIGDEIYRVALMWMAVGLIGADTGYVGAAQSASLLLLSLIGGKWADHWNSLNTMFRVDALRGLIVLIPVGFFYFAPPSLTVLVVVALSVSALSAFFDPALQASLPELCPDGKTLQAANGVMSITARLARVVGPGIIGFLSALVPLIHFFTLDALSFAASAFSINLVRRRTRPAQCVKQAKVRTRFSDALMAGFRLVERVERMRYVMFAKAITSSAWNLGYSLGFALLANEIAPHDVRSFSLIVAAYGFGNVVGALVFANIERKNPERLMFFGYVWLGLGFLMIGLAPSLPLIMAAAIFAAIGGPMNDVAFIDLMQLRFETKDLTKIFRLRMAVETAGTLVCMFFAPLFLKLASVHVLLALCGVAILAAGLYGVFTVKVGPSPQSAL